jgi:zinc/manganese transport system permease protein
VIGAAGFALGLVLSALLDLPSGAVIAWSLAACGLPSALLRTESAPR